ncbi:MAG: HIT family protein [Fibrobacter sp.]|nr:HIT family protein [Fibrobacter sp.]
MHPQECIFCSIVSGRNQAAIVYKDSFSIAFLDKTPLFPGHTLLVPRNHVSELEALSPEETGLLFNTARLLTIAVEKATFAQGTFIAVNNKVSQSIPHLHVHIVPRTKGDGLRGFFWPRKKYGSEKEMTDIAERISKEMNKV